MRKREVSRASDLPLDELSSLIARIQGMLLTEETVAHAVDLLAEAIRESIPGAVGAGVSLMDDQGRRTSTGSTDGLVVTADELQYRLGKGPCLEAWAGAAPVRSDDLAAEIRWPGWSGPAAELGLRSVLSVPLLHKTEILGAMKIYSTETAAFNERSEHLLTLFAGPAATLLANVQSTEVPHRASRELKDAIASRDSIALARGILMERKKLNSEEAMGELIMSSRSNGHSLRSVSEQVIMSVSNQQRY
ncbi:GAF and ANTAR domain-containing protein [Arthrobacter sp. zg-Y238]|uniref:GAF and ANTAR domain-containing protein n=1 Tax=Arthrobacter sp. zg-Y238 TaxID=2964614 RepID=UPI00210626EF|nr:GAF and ANTAR domain-containing protein [Arthrobacter sp. zg-Y238]MCQ1954587.1 GAF and ANTAR domain-containing protein [Arthrobacter sp. zg-Y238]